MELQTDLEATSTVAAVRILGQFFPVQLPGQQAHGDIAGGGGGQEVVGGRRG
jgi:hypothetical protein